MDMHRTIIHELANVPKEIDALRRFLTALKPKAEDTRDYLCERNVEGRIIGCPWGNLHGYVFSGLSNKERRDVYQSAYEPGHPDKELPSDSESDLFDYLEQTYGGSVNDLCKAIKSDIKLFTGVPFACFLKRDRVTANRVLTLFYRLHRFRPKLRSLLHSNNNKGCNFEFRAEFPMLDNPKAVENTALISEILTRLTFLLEGKERQDALAAHDVINGARGFIADSFLNEYTSAIDADGLTEDASLARTLTLIEQWSAGLPLVSMPVGSAHSLAMQLCIGLRIREFVQRTKSEARVIDTVLAHPLNLNPYATATWQGRSDTECLTYLTQANKPLRLKQSLAAQAAYLESIVVTPWSGFETSRGLSLLIKAVILHDDKLNICLPSSITGLSCIEDSPRALLKKAVKFTRGDSDTQRMDTNRSPEALSLYWDSRIRLAVAQQNYGLSRGRLRFEHRAEIEQKVTTRLGHYLECGGTAAFHNILSLYGEPDD
ncbi:hypothetical protein ACE012_14165 [Shewanella xiamenensis]|uniref:hypothetical protein n=1 Tax=Shewanella xiamenensis TaxID=332186 RepID=UPI0035BA42B3